MGKIRSRQVEGFTSKQKKIIDSAKTPTERAEAFGLWAGFITGLRITKVITQEEYKELLTELEAYEGAAQIKRRNEKMDEI